MSIWEKDYNKIRKYFTNHPDYNGAVHLIAGMGIGVLMTYPLVGVHPVRWSILLLIIAFIGHLYPIVLKK